MDARTRAEEALALSRKATYDRDDWRVEREHDLWVQIASGHGLSRRMIADCLSQGDAEGIVSARTSLPALARDVLALEAENEAMRKALAGLLDVVEMSEVSCREIEPHKHEAVLEDALSRAAAALILSPKEPKHGS